MNCAREPKEFWLVPGAKHNQSVMVEPIEYVGRTIDFFDCYLAGQSETANRFRADRPLESRVDSAPPPRQIDSTAARS